MAGRLHPVVEKNLSQFLAPNQKANENLKNLQHLFREICTPKSDEYAFSLNQFLAALGNEIETSEDYQREPAQQESVENSRIHHQLTKLRELLIHHHQLHFPNTYQCCAFLLLTLFPEKNQEEILNDLSPNPLLFETTESYDYDGDPSFRWEDPLTTRLVIDWCPHSLLTDPDILAELIWKDHLTSFQPFKETCLYKLYSYFADLPFEELPHLLKTTGRFGINEWIQLRTFPNLKSWAQEQLAECILRLDKDEYRLKEDLPTIPHYEEMIQHLDLSSFDQQKQKEYWTSAISTVPHLIQHVPIHFRQNHADLFQLAVQKDPRTVIFAQPEDAVPDNQLRSILQQHPLLFAHLPEKTKGNIELLKIVIEKEPKLYRYLPANLKANPNFANTALDVNPYCFPEIQAHFIPDAGRIKKIIETNPLLITPHYITGNYTAETSLCEQYLGAILSSKNEGLLDLEDDETNFKTREEELIRNLHIPKEIPRKNHLSKGLAKLLENTDNPETDSPF
jgi:hypothetical protein